MTEHATAADAWAQRGHRVRLGWGPTGGAAVAAGADVAVVLDVLSFTTTVTVAVDLGVAVLPYRWNDAGAADFAARHDAALAHSRAKAGPGDLSLSPGSLQRAASRGTLPSRLVLPSPNGATIAHGLAAGDATVVAASLRNATAVGGHLHALGPDAVIAVVAAGERWPDGSLRPADEDLWGAGAVLAALVGLGAGGLSPEAETAVAAHRAFRGREAALLTACASGRELAANGYPDEVGVAAQVDAGTAVPVLRDGAFTAGLTPG